MVTREKPPDLKTIPTSSASPDIAAVPMLDLRRQYEAIRDKVLAAIEKVCDSQGFILGPEVEALEREIAAFTGAVAAVGCASGTEALWLALLGAGVEPGDRVITTAFSFFASASSIVRAGATPLLMDVEPGTLNLDASVVREQLEKEKSSSRAQAKPGRVTAILPVHLYGQCADMGAFDALAEEFDVAIVEDAAQAIGAAWDGHGAGSMGATAAFSFYPTKNLSAYGDAGIVTTNDLGIAEHMRQLRNHGSPRRYYHDEFGWNGRIDAIQAAVLRVKLPLLPAWNAARLSNAAIYDQCFADAGFTPPSPSSPDSSKVMEEVSRTSPIRLLARNPRANHVFHQYVICAYRRDELRQFLTERKIGTEIYYPLPIHLQPVFEYLGLKDGDLPVAERAAKEVLALPMFAELTEPEIRHVVDTISQFYG